MAAKGYTTIAEVAAYLGLTLSAAQEAEATSLILKAEAHVDRKTGRVWKVATVTAEQHDLEGPSVFLRTVPVSSITSIVGTLDSSPLETALTADVDYWLLDPVAGELHVECWKSYDRIEVTYASNSSIPEELGLAATMLVAHWLTPALMPDSFGVEQMQAGSDLSVKFRPSTVPFTVQDIIKRYRGLRA